MRRRHEAGGGRRKGKKCEEGELGRHESDRNVQGIQQGRKGMLLCMHGNGLGPAGGGSSRQLAVLIEETDALLLPLPSKGSGGAIRAT